MEAHVTTKKTLSQDPLFILFERHLYRCSTEAISTAEFIELVVQDYVNYLLTQGVNIPNAVRPALIEDLTEEVREMTLKKTYGSVSVSNFQDEAAQKVAGNAKTGGQAISRPIQRKIA